MKLTDFARHLPEEVWHLFAPLLPRRVVWQRPPPSEQLRLLACGVLCARQRHCVADAAHRLPVLQNRPTPPAGLAPVRYLSHRVATARAPLCSVAGHQLGAAPASMARQEAIKKGGEQTGPSPVDRGKCGTALPRALLTPGQCRWGPSCLGPMPTTGVKPRGLFQRLGVQPPMAERTTGHPRRAKRATRASRWRLRQSTNAGAGAMGRVSFASAQARQRAAGRGEDSQCCRALPEFFCAIWADIPAF